MSHYFRWSFHRTDGPYSQKIAEIPDLLGTKQEANQVCTKALESLPARGPKTRVIAIHHEKIEAQIMTRILALQLALELMAEDWALGRSPSGLDRGQLVTEYLGKAIVRLSAPGAAPEHKLITNL